MRNYYLFLFLLGYLLATAGMASAQVVSKLSGTVRDSTDGRPLHRAAIIIDYEGKGRGTFTDENGYFEIYLTPSTHAVVIRHVGYRSFRTSLLMSSNRTLNVALINIANELEEVIVTSKGVDGNVQRPILGVNQLNMRALKKLPSALGETDILRGLQMLPGVTSVGEAANGVNIRGGTTDQTLILLDDTPIFNPTHMFGLFSAFPPDAIGSLDLYKANAPARFGGRAAAVMDVSIAQPSLTKTSLTGGIGLVSNRFGLSVPLVKDRLGLTVSGRAALNDFLLPIASQRLKDIRARFADGAAKLFYRINDRNTLTASGYWSKDFFQTDLLGTIGDINATSTQYDHRSLNGAVRWFHAISSRMNVQTSVIYADYVPKILLPELDSDNRVELVQRVQHRQVKSDLNYTAGPHKLEGGLSATHYRIRPGDLLPNASTSVNPVRTPPEQGLELALYAEDEVRLSARLTASLGLRYGQFLALGPGAVRRYQQGELRDEFTITDTLVYGPGGVMQTYGGLEPRVGLRYTLDEQTSLKLGYNLMRQYLQVVTNTATPLPTARWKTSDAHVRPQASHLLAGGVFRNFKDNIYEFSAEAYYRFTQNVLDYKPGADFLLQAYPETQLLQGVNRSYGLELMLTKKKGELNGWVNYTYARSLNQVAEGPAYLQRVNDGNPYPANYDRPHTVNASVILGQGKHHTFSFTFAYSTGRPYTPPRGVIQYQGQGFPFYADRNTARIPDYHRLDFSWNIYNPTMKARRWQGHWVFTVYNLYGRKNAYSVFFRNRGTLLEPNKLTVFAAPIPTLTYNFRFE
jgi:hypothetical protein